ncbi:MAG: gamma-glutamyl-gamma-aminobutyrate hydrolase family protein, partial [Mycobacterium sp.]
MTVRLQDVLPDLPTPDAPRAHICVLASLNYPDISEADIALIKRFTKVALATLIELGADFELYDTTEPLDSPSSAAYFDGLLLLGGGDVDNSCYGMSTPHPTT